MSDNRQRGGVRRVWALNATLGVVATGLLLIARAVPSYPSELHIPVWALATMFYLTECYVVHIEFKRDAESFSLNEIAIVLALFFASPLELVLAQAIGAAIALTVKRRQPPVKLAFNVMHLAIEAMAASIVFHAIAQPTAGLSLREVAAALAGATTAIVLGVFAVVGVISLAEGRLQRSMLPRVLVLGLIGTFTNTCLALLGVAILRQEPGSAWLLAVPAATLFLAYRAYTTERRQHHALGRLYESTRSMQLTREVERAVHGLLEQAREMFRADTASLTLFGSAPGEPAVRSTMGPGTTSEMMLPVLLDPMAGVWARVAAERQGVLLPRPIDAPGLRNHFAEQGINDAMFAPVFGDEGVITGVIMVANRTSDIDTFSTEDMRFFETLANHASISMQNVRLVARLREALSYQTELNRLKDEFVALVSHELRSPLTSIQGYVQTMLARDLGEEDRRHGLEVIDRQSERLRGLIEDLLLVSKIESQQIAPALKPVETASLIEQLGDGFRNNLRGHILTLDVEPELQEIDSDPESIHRVLANFVDNALKYSPVGSEVRVTARRQGGKLLLSVHDQGDGVPAELHERIFDRFFQADQSLTRSVGGAGLGLYICRRLAESIGGSVSLERSDRTGSTFTLSLPQRQPAVVNLVAPRMHH